MAVLTANAQDEATITSLRALGGVTVMVALLANESGAIQELACMSLANLLCTLNNDVKLPYNEDPRHGEQPSVPMNQMIAQWQHNLDLVIAQVSRFSDLSPPLSPLSFSPLSLLFLSSLVFLVLTTPLPPPSLL